MKEYVTDQEASGCIFKATVWPGVGVGPVGEETVKGVEQLVRQPDVEQAGPWRPPKARCV